MTEAVATRPAVRLPELGLWNLYFLIKFVLLWMGLLDFNALLNLLLAAGLLLPLPGRWLPRLRQVIAVPLGVALFYKDTWYPPFRRLFEQSEVLAFSVDYVIDLLGRFVNWDVLGVLFAIALLYLFIAPWLRLTVVTVALLLWVYLAGALPAFNVPVQSVAGEVSTTQGASSEVAESKAIDAWLDQFYREQAGKVTRFPEKNPTAEPFDVLILNVCSLAWDDLEDAGMRDNALLRRMNIVFDRFNSATSYSGPAAIRMLRASCGQPHHIKLYEPANEQCMLFDNLAKLGYAPELMLNHNGPITRKYMTFLAGQHLPPPLMSSDDFPVALKSYDGANIARDRDVWMAWWAQRIKDQKPAVSLFYNTITLHDGNRVTNPDGSTRRASFQERAKNFLDDLDQFIDTMKQSGRRVVLVLVPEHGAAVHGDRMQISGMREIPSRSITHVPTAIKLINMGESDQQGPLHVTTPTSHLAVSELIARLYAQQGGPLDLEALIHDLPTTAAVSENSDSAVVEFQGRPYVRLKGQTEWMLYPE
ncbi:cellulose biosynthesis protein BcsG [Pseudomonas alkylphenolica]|uniref:Cellulose biosynthesis protein BcsG n=1 Tax=Pseudomonas alkylphenolica TaxID=237609 RepID=A0A443ZJW5_9PSED|nr:cellulose biosynthesis protein BcsG [Pseudomonas alkylphenolica]RWU19148.1 cellulose biosynthesis protein BcsG [Pseudomonas alkylphenolica]